MRNWLSLAVVPALGALAIRLLGKTMNWSVVGGEGIDDLYRNNQRGIIAFWHGQQLMMPLAYRGTAASILISHHRDGELIARIMKRFNFQAIRGSTTRGGTKALRQLLDVSRQGQDLVLTPDGPKGPPRKVQMGVMYLARMTRRPILPLTFACSKKKSFPVGTVFRFLFPDPEVCSSGISHFGWRQD